MHVLGVHTWIRKTNVLGFQKHIFQVKAKLPAAWKTLKRLKTMNKKHFFFAMADKCQKTLRWIKMHPMTNFSPCRLIIMLCGAPTKLLFIDEMKVLWKLNTLRIHLYTTHTYWATEIYHGLEEIYFSPVPIYLLDF